MRPTTTTATPDGATVKRTGNVYFADCYNHRVRKISPKGIINTVAGGGAGGVGDGGQATKAELLGPTSVAVDGVGSLYIAEPRANRVRKVSPAGIITTVAG